jgi:membrane protein involved in colicin uptake
MPRNLELHHTTAFTWFLTEDQEAINSLIESLEGIADKDQATAVIKWLNNTDNLSLARQARYHGTITEDEYRAWKEVRKIDESNKKTWLESHLSDKFALDMAVAAERVSKDDVQKARAEAAAIAEELAGMAADAQHRDNADNAWEIAEEQAAAEKAAAEKAAAEKAAAEKAARERLMDVLKHTGYDAFAFGASATVLAAATMAIRTMVMDGVLGLNLPILAAVAGTGVVIGGIIGAASEYSMQRAAQSIANNPGDGMELDF